MVAPAFGTMTRERTRGAVVAAPTVPAHTGPSGPAVAAVVTPETAEPDVEPTTPRVPYPSSRHDRSVPPVSVPRAVYMTRGWGP
ncbi:hypothetical protein GCM10023223_29150 [Stackebrandtia albiflava]